MSFSRTNFSPVEIKIIRACDIRGVVGDGLSEQVFYQMGAAIARQLHDLGKQAIFLAEDARLTSPAFAFALSEGLRDGGINVYDLGMVPTPVLYYASYTHPQIDCGLMVTGSHNPAAYNGLKLVINRRAVLREALLALHQTMHLPFKVSPRGERQSYDIWPAYEADILSRLDCTRPLKLVIDAGNGVAGPFALRLMQAMGCETIDLFCNVDGTFPNHHPDPAVVDNLAWLVDAVRASGADLGLAFDGDGDRLGVVTHQGEVVGADRLLMYFAEDLLTHHPGAAVVYDVKCSDVLAQEIARLGGQPKVCRTGHAHVKKMLIDEGALLAGEMSGHLFFSEGWYGFDDALYSAARLIAIASQHSAPLAEALAKLPTRISTPEIKLEVPDDLKHQIVEAFRVQADFPLATCLTIDGVKVQYDDGFGLIRASQTTSALTFRFEATTLERLKAIQETFRVQLQPIIPFIKIPF